MSPVDITCSTEQDLIVLVEEHGASSPPAELANTLASPAANYLTEENNSNIHLAIKVTLTSFGGKPALDLCT